MPCTNSILLVKHDKYIQNYSDKGFQFEQLVTGQPIQAREEISFIEHMHYMKIGDHGVLFLAEVDALRDDEPIEITASNPRYWGTGKLFQCLSNGSPALCHGHKWRGDVNTIQLKSLSQLAQDALLLEDPKTLEENIQDCLESIMNQLEQFEKGAVCELSFSGDIAKLIARPEKSWDLLPSKDVVWELLE